MRKAAYESRNCGPNGLPGEQATMFFLDPSGNALEFKAFADISRLFAK
jgi:extradiol dioxygenase family protein